MIIKHLQTGKESEVSYSEWTHKYINSEEKAYKRYLVLNYGDLVRVNQLEKGNRKYLYILDREQALSIIRSNPHRFEIDEQERSEIDKIYLILQYLVSKSDNKKYCFDSEEVACGTGILPEETRYLLEKIYKKRYVGNNTAIAERRRNVFSVTTTPKTKQVLQFGEYSNYIPDVTKEAKPVGIFNFTKSFFIGICKSVERIHKVASPIRTLVWIVEVILIVGPLILFYFNEVHGWIFSMIEFVKVP